MIAPHHRRGVTILEALLALAVLSLTFGLLAQFLAATAQQKRIGEQRRLALQESANALEQVAALSWEDLTTEKLAAVVPSPALTGAIPHAELKLQVQAEAGPPEAKRVRVEVSWPNAAGVTGEPIGLTAFFYPPPEEQP